MIFFLNSAVVRPLYVPELIADAVAGEAALAGEHFVALARRDVRRPDRRRRRSAG